MRKRTYAVVGTGGRAADFIEPMVSDYRDEAELLGFCDTSQVRMDYYRNRLKKEYAYEGIHTYLANDFEKMLDELHPDVVIICTIDRFHHEYIIKAINKGCDVVCEKPITIDDEKCRAILSASGLARQNIRITFNVRRAPLSTMVKKMITEGKIGEVKHIHYEAIGGILHGGRYFGRWHGNKENSGGLVVHKSTHHFDLANWWCDSIPAEVFAYGSMAYFGRENALRRGQNAWTENARYTGAAEPEKNPFHIDLNDSDMTKNLYMAAEEETGYIYDRNAFRDDVDIEDTLSVMVRYRNGVLLNYSYIAYSSWAGYRVNITGDRGRLEYEQVVRPPNSQESSLAAQTLTYLPLFQDAQIIDIPKVEGKHGGGDPRIQEQVFSLHPPVDPYGRSAGCEQGIASAIIGIAANRSMAENRPVQIKDLIDLQPKTKSLHELIR